MKNVYTDDIRKAFKSKEYWFGFSIIVISCVLTSIYNLGAVGIFSDYKIGSSEFFIAATMFSNTLMQISAPVIAIFVCMNRDSLFFRRKESLGESWNKKEIKARILAITTIGSSVFLISFLLLLIIGIILFPSSTGSMQPQLGLFKQVYSTSPFGYCIAYIIHSCICGALYALFGASLKVCFVQPVNIALFIPLIFYSCFGRMAILFPFVSNFISFVAPLYTFDISVIDISPKKRIAELLFVLVISMLLIFLSYRKFKKCMIKEREI